MTKKSGFVKAVAAACAVSMISGMYFSYSGLIGEKLKSVLAADNDQEAPYEEIYYADDEEDIIQESDVSGIDESVAAEESQDAAEVFPDTETQEDDIRYDDGEAPDSLTETEEETEVFSDDAPTASCVGITRASGINEFIERISAVSSQYRLIIDTDSDLSDLEDLSYASGVFYDGTYILSFPDEESYNEAADTLEYFDIPYSVDGMMEINSGIDISLQNEVEVNSGGSVRIAVIDTGSQLANETYSVIDDDGADRNGHGTAMASLILEEDTSFSAYIISIKAIDDSGTGRASDVYAAVELAESIGVDYILLSVSMRDLGQFEAFKDLLRNTNAEIIASAGNNGTNAAAYIPAGVSGVITVGAVDESAVLRPISNYGACVNYYPIADSTSEAAARAAGRIIAARAEGRELTDEDISAYAVCPQEHIVYSFGSTEYFEINEPSTSGHRLYLTAVSGDDMNGRSTDQFRSGVRAYASSNWPDGGGIGTNYPNGCIQFAFAAVQAGTGRITQYGTDGFTSHTDDSSPSGGWRWDISRNTTVDMFMSFAGYAVTTSSGHNVGITGIRRGSSDYDILISDWRAVYDYITANAVPGDILAFSSGTSVQGGSDEWVHMAVYMGPAPGMAQFNGNSYDGISVSQASFGSTGATIAQQNVIIGPGNLNDMTDLVGKHWRQVVILKPGSSEVTVTPAPSPAPSPAAGTVTFNKVSQAFDGSLNDLKTATISFKPVNGNVFDMRNAVWTAGEGVTVNQDSSQIVFDTSAEGTDITIRNLAPGDYVFVETGTPSGFVTASPIYVTVASDGSVTPNNGSVTMINTQIETRWGWSTLGIRKVWEGDTGGINNSDYSEEDFWSDVSNITFQMYHVGTKEYALQFFTNGGTLYGGREPFTFGTLGLGGISRSYDENWIDHETSQYNGLHYATVYWSTALKNSGPSSDGMPGHWYEYYSPTAAGWIEPGSGYTGCISCIPDGTYIMVTEEWHEGMFSSREGEDMYIATANASGWHEIIRTSDGFVKYGMIFHISGGHTYYCDWDTCNDIGQVDATIVGQVQNYQTERYSYVKNIEESGILDVDKIDASGTGVEGVRFELWRGASKYADGYIAENASPSGVSGDRYDCYDVRWNYAQSHWTNNHYETTTGINRNAVYDLQYGTYQIREYADDIGSYRVPDGWNGHVNDAGDIDYFYIEVNVTDAYRLTPLRIECANYRETWFNLLKEVTVSGDAGTVSADLYYMENDGTWTLAASGQTFTDGPGLYGFTWDYSGGHQTVNGIDTISLPRGQYQIREYEPETFYQNGRDNAVYTYMVPEGFTVHEVGDDGRADFFYKDISIGYEPVTMVSETVQNTRIEASLTINKLEMTNSVSSGFSFEVYYRGNGEAAADVGVFDDEHFLDTITVYTNDGSGSGRLQKLPEGWYEIIEVNASEWNDEWYNTSTNTGTGKLVHATSDRRTTASITITDNIKILGQSIDGVLIANIISPELFVYKSDAWTHDLVLNPQDHPDGVHLTFYLYRDGNGNGMLDDYEQYGFVASVDGDDDGQLVFEDLEEGHYILREVATINGYYLDAKDIPVCIEGPVNVRAYPENTPYMEKVAVAKIDNETSEYLSGAEFKVFTDTNDNGVFDDEDAVAQMWVDYDGDLAIDDDEITEAILFETSNGKYESGWLHFNDGSVRFGNRYFIVETRTPDQYFYVDEDGDFTGECAYRTFVIDAKDTAQTGFLSGDHQEFVFRNQTGTVSVRKTDEEGIFLPGARFGIYTDEECTNLFAILTEDDSDEVYSYKGLGIGSWYLKELQAPLGFEVDPNVYEFEITFDDVHPAVTNHMSEKYGINGCFVDVSIHTTSYVPDISGGSDVYVVSGMRSEETVIIDSVWFDGLIIGKTYTVTGEFRYQDDGQIVTDLNGNPVMTSYTFEAGDEYDEKQAFTVNADGKTIEGHVDIEFTVNTESWTGTAVAFETVTDNASGAVVGIHMDLNDAPQSITVPSIRTTLVNSSDGSHSNRCDDNSSEMTLTDTVFYENLIAGERYILTGMLVEKDTGETVDVNGNGVSVYTVFTVPVTSESIILNNGVILSSGTVDVDFTVDISSLCGKDLVAFEYLYQTGTDSEPVEITRHADLEDEGQTVRITEDTETVSSPSGPSLETTLIDPDTGDHISGYSQSETLIDTVRFSGLIPGRTYTVTGILMNKMTGTQLISPDGNTYVSTVEFTPDNSNGTVEVVFEVDTASLSGETIVAFERVESDGVTVVSHEDLNDLDQTVYVPGLHTTAVIPDNGGKIITSSGDYVINDHIEYCNLIPGREYTIAGSVQYVITDDNGAIRESGILSLNGQEINSRKTFVPETSCGYTDIEFVLSGLSDMGYDRLVVFEDLFNDTGVRICSHEDLDDEGQTIYMPGMYSRARASGGGRSVAPVESVVIVDAVYYRGLVPGCEYRLETDLMNFATGESVEHISTVFKTHKSSGRMEIPIRFDGRGFTNEKMVVFEKIYDNKTGLLIKAHDDWNEEEQTITFVPRTGVHGMNHLMIPGVLLMTASLSLSGAYKRPEKKKKKYKIRPSM